MQDRQCWLEDGGAEASGILGAFLMGLAWVLFPRGWSVCRILELHVLLSVHVPCSWASLADEKVLAFLSALLGSSPCHTQADVLRGLLGGSHNGSCPKLGLQGPPNEGLRGSRWGGGHAKMSDEKGFPTAPGDTRLPGQCQAAAPEWRSQL